MEIDSRKRKIEAAAIPKLKAIFRNMAKDAESLYRKSGFVNTKELAQNYYPEFLKEIRDVMRKTIKEFEGDLQDKFKVKIDPIDYTIFVANESEFQAKFITETNANEIQLAITQEELKFSNQKALPEWILIAQNLQINLLDKSEARSELIAAQVVGLTESWTRHTEAEEVNKKEPLKKTWIAILDKRTRPAHVAADFQQVAINENFIVDGESLKYPRDPNGSAANIINCRCIVDYSKFG